MTDQRKRERPEDYFSDWKQREALAESMIPQVGRLAREKNVKCYIYGRSLVNKSVTDLMKIHRYVRQVENNEIYTLCVNMRRLLLRTPSLWYPEGRLTKGFKKDLRAKVTFVTEDGESVKKDAPKDAEENNEADFDAEFGDIEGEPKIKSPYE